MKEAGEIRPKKHRRNPSIQTSVVMTRERKGAGPGWMWLRGREHRATYNSVNNINQIEF